jgi:UDP-glucose 4-epimerase
VGGEEEYSINELALLVKETLRSSSPVKHLSYREAYGDRYRDIMLRRPDLTLLKSLGYDRKLRPIREVIREIAAKHQDKE